MSRHHHITRLALLATLGTLQFNMAHAAQQWLVQPIVDPANIPSNSEFVEMTGLNNSGVVVGQKGAMGFITGPNGVGFQSLGNVFGRVGIDEAGEASSISRSNGFVFITPPNSVTQITIATLPGASQNSFSGISSDGRITGQSCIAVSITETNCSKIYFTGPHGVGVTEWIREGRFYNDPVKGINSSGQLIGNRGIPTVNQVTGLYNTHAFLTGPNGTGYQDLGTLGGESSTAVGVNDSGQVAGTSELVAGQAKQRAFLTGPNGAAMKDLGDLGGGQSKANGLNNLGQVVGTSHVTTTDWDTAAFITGPNGVGMRNLTKEVSLPDNDLVKSALAINDKGQVLVDGTNYKSYLLTPMPVGECAVTYKVTYTGFGLFTAQVSVNNQSAVAQSDWAVSWQYSVRPLYLVNNAKITANGTSFAATPTTSTKTIKAKSTVTFTLTGSTKAGKAPSVSGLIANLAGKSCTATVQ